MGRAAKGGGGERVAMATAEQESYETLLRAIHELYHNPDQEVSRSRSSLFQGSEPRDQITLIRD